MDFVISCLSFRSNYIQTICRPDCGALPEELESDDSCKPYVAGACAAKTFAVDKERTQTDQLQCTDFDGLSEVFANELRRTVGKAQDEPQFECAVQIVEEKPVPEQDLNLWLVVALPIILCLLCCGAIAAALIVRSKRQTQETNVTVEQQAGGSSSAAATAADDSDSWEPSE